MIRSICCTTSLKDDGAILRLVALQLLKLVVLIASHLKNSSTVWFYVRLTISPFAPRQCDSIT